MSSLDSTPTSDDLMSMETLKALVAANAAAVARLCAMVGVQFDAPRESTPPPTVPICVQGAVGALPVLVETPSTTALQPCIVPKPRPSTPTKCSMECLDDETCQVMPTLLRDLSFPAILLPPMRKGNEQHKWLPPTHMKVAEDNGERPRPWPPFVGRPCQELMLMPSPFCMTCHSGVHQKQFWPPPQGIYLELSIGDSNEVYWCSVVQQADDHGDRSAIITCQKDKGLLLENPQDALSLEGPKPEPEIDVPTAPVANHLNIGSSESHTAHSEAQNNGGSLQEEAVEAYAPFVKPIAWKHAADRNGARSTGGNHKEGAEEQPMPLPSFVCYCQGMISMQPQQTPQGIPLIFVSEDMQEVLGCPVSNSALPMLSDGAKSYFQFKCFFPGSMKMMAQCLALPSSINPALYPTWRPPERATHQAMIHCFPSATVLFKVHGDLSGLHSTLFHEKNDNGWLYVLHVFLSALAHFPWQIPWPSPHGCCAILSLWETCCSSTCALGFINDILGSRTLWLVIQVAAKGVWWSFSWDLGEHNTCILTLHFQMHHVKLGQVELFNIQVQLSADRALTSMLALDWCISLWYYCQLYHMCEFASRSTKLVQKNVWSIQVHVHKLLVVVTGNKFSSCSTGLHKFTTTQVQKTISAKQFSSYASPTCGLLDKVLELDHEQNTDVLVVIPGFLLLLQGPHGLDLSTIHEPSGVYLVARPVQWDPRDGHDPGHTEQPWRLQKLDTQRGGLIMGVYELSVPWDPGGCLHRLGGKPKLKEGVMSRPGLCLVQTSGRTVGRCVPWARKQSTEGAT